MVDFVGLLKRTIDAQSSATPALRRRIYDRTRETVERQMADKNIAENIRAMQRGILADAIAQVEADYQRREHGDVFAALTENAGIKAPPPIFPASPKPGNYSEAEIMPAAQAGFSRQGEKSAGNAYFARSPGAAPAAGEAAYNSAPAPAPNNSSGGSLFSLDDDDKSPDDEYGGFSPYGQQESGFAPDFGASARRRPDFGEDFLPPAESAQTPDSYAPAPSLSGFSAYGETENSAGARSAYGDAPRGDVFDQQPDTPYSLDGTETPARGGSHRDFPGLSDFPLGGDSDGGRESPPDWLYSEDPEQETASEAYGRFPAGDLPAADKAPRPAAKAADKSSGSARGSLPPMPDFLTEEPGSSNAPSAAAPGRNEAFNLEQALRPAKDKTARRGSEAAADGDADILPEMRESSRSRQRDNRGESAAAANNAAAGALTAGGDVASGIFAQAAIQEKRRSSKKRLINGGLIILALLVMFGGIFWFLTDFLKSDSRSLSAPVNKEQPAGAPRAELVEKANQRLTANGEEVGDVPQPADKNAGAGANANPGPDAGATGAAADSGSAAAAPQAAGEAIFREAASALMPPTSANGTVEWSLLHEKTAAGADDTVLHGELTVPDRDIVMHMTIRPNHDAGIPAVYLIELAFMVPENFEGIAIDNISPLMFKATQQSTSQELQDTRIYKISENGNFFVITLNTPQNSRNPQLMRNIALMEQLPWLSLNVAYKNGRIGEFTFSKGSQGETLFKQFFDAQSPAERGIAPSPNAAKQDAGKKDGNNNAPAPAANPAGK